MCYLNNNFDIFIPKDKTAPDLNLKPGAEEFYFNNNNRFVATNEPLFIR